jgi:hypothetical protein
LREWEEGLKARNRGIIAIFCPGEGEVFFFSLSLGASEVENRPNDQESLLIFYFYFLKL